MRSDEGAKQIQEVMSERMQWRTKGGKAMPKQATGFLSADIPAIVLSAGFEERCAADGADASRGEVEAVQCAHVPLHQPRDGHGALVADAV